MLESGLGNLSARKLLSNIYREHGLKGLYRGFTATALRDIGYGAYFLGVRTFTAYNITLVDVP
jgi:solute carrier family 25 carnitine/acylcarnitine transporter 20/29